LPGSLLEAPDLLLELVNSSEELTNFSLGSPNSTKKRGCSRRKIGASLGEIHEAKNDNFTQWQLSHAPVRYSLVTLRRRDEREREK